MISDYFITLFPVRLHLFWTFWIGLFIWVVPCFYLVVLDSFVSKCLSRLNLVEMK